MHLPPTTVYGLSGAEQCCFGICGLDWLDEQSGDVSCPVLGSTNAIPPQETVAHCHRSAQALCPQPLRLAPQPELFLQLLAVPHPPGQEKGKQSKHQVTSQNIKQLLKRRVVPWWSWGCKTF